MLLKQISVFVENRQGAIKDITEVLSNAGVNIRAISIADTTDYGVIRLIVDKRKLALSALRENNMTVKETDVVGLIVDDAPGGFNGALAVLSANGVMVEYCYGFVTPIGNNATIILKCDNQEKANECLETNGFELITAEDVKF